MPDISSPSISLAALAPLLFVFGAAAVGVLVEAFAPRESRHPVQVGVALVGTLGGLVSTLLLSGTEEVTAGGAPAIDGAGPPRPPPRPRRRGAVPAGDADRVRRAGDPDVRRAGAGPGPLVVRGHGRGPRRQPARPRTAHRPPGADRGLPAGDVRPRRHDAVRHRERPAADVRGARGAQPAAVPDVRPGPPPAAAVAGGLGP